MGIATVGLSVVQLCNEKWCGGNAFPPVHLHFCPTLTLPSSAPKAMFLKYLNSMLKGVAGALEIVGTAVVSYLIFGTSLGISTTASVSWRYNLCVCSSHLHYVLFILGIMVQVLLITSGVWLYSTSPVKNSVQ